MTRARALHYTHPASHASQVSYLRSYPGLPQVVESEEEEEDDDDDDDDDEDDDPR